MALYGKSSNEHFENIKKGITRIYEHQKKGFILGERQESRTV